MLSSLSKQTPLFRHQVLNIGMQERDLQDLSCTDDVYYRDRCIVRDTTLHNMDLCIVPHQDGIFGSNLMSETGAQR